MKSAKKLTEKVKSAFTKKYGRTAVEGEEPTFHTSKTHGGTIPYLPGKYRQEFGEEIINLDEDKKTKNQNHNSQKKVQSKTQTKQTKQTNKQNKSK